jgi:hypothetical protein
MRYLHIAQTSMRVLQELLNPQCTIIVLNVFLLLNFVCESKKGANDVYEGMDFCNDINAWLF